MKHYFFSETISGEQFLVGAGSEKAATLIAIGIAKDIGNEYNENDEWDLVCHGEVTEEEAEDSGLDEY